MYFLDPLLKPREKTVIRESEFLPPWSLCSIGGEINIQKYI